MRQSERLWHLLYEYGWTEHFSGVWVAGLGLPELGRCLGVKAGDARLCDRAALSKVLLDSYGDGATIIWADRLNDDWLQIIEPQGTACSTALAELSGDGRRAVGVAWGPGGVRDLRYAVDGEEITRFSVTTPDRRSGRVPDALDSAAQGLLFDLDDPGWRTDPELPPAWTAFEEWFVALQEGGGVEGDLEGQEPLPPEFATLYEWSLNGYHPALATSITSALALAGRITGKEIDREWLSGSHPCMSIPLEK